MKVLGRLYHIFPWTRSAYPLKKIVVLFIFSWFWFWISLRIIWVKICVTNHSQTSSFKTTIFFCLVLWVGNSGRAQPEHIAPGFLLPFQSDVGWGSSHHRSSVLSHRSTVRGSPGSSAGAVNKPTPTWRSQGSQTSCVVAGECPKRTRQTSLSTDSAGYNRITKIAPPPLFLGEAYQRHILKLPYQCFCVFLLKA